MPNSLKFGTSGLRGLATDLVGAESRRYTAAFVAHLRTRGPVTEMLVGRDLRASSPQIAPAVIAGLTGAGALLMTALAVKEGLRGLAGTPAENANPPGDVEMGVRRDA